MWLPQSSWYIHHLTCLPFCLCWGRGWEHKIYSLSNFQILLTILTILHIRDLEFIHLVTGCPYPLINLSHFSCNHCSGLWFYNFFKVCVCALSCVWLCIPMDCSPLGSSVHGILPARILEWVASSFIRGTSQPRDHTHNSFVSCIADKFFTTETLIHISETLL